MPPDQGSTPYFTANPKDAEVVILRTRVIELEKAWAQALAQNANLAHANSDLAAKLAALRAGIAPHPN